MIKNAISILQEYYQKRGEPLPMYNEICTPVGIYPNKFRYRCTCGPYKADGDGANKKDAKLRAAEAMISILSTEKDSQRFVTQKSEIISSTQLDSFPSSGTTTCLPFSQNNFNESDRNSPIVSSTHFVNNVGELQELCVRSRLKMPYYRNNISAKGFYSVCKIGTHEVDGTAPTKKGAKHTSAGEMLKLLIEKYPRLVRENAHKTKFSTESSTTLPLLELKLDGLKISDQENEEIITDKVKNIFMNQKNENGVLTTTNDISVKNFHVIFKNSFDQKVLDEFHNFYNSFQYEKLLNVGELKMILDKICSILTLENEINFTEVVNRFHMVEFKLNSYPPFSNIEIDSNLMIAQQKCLSRCIYKIYSLLL